MLYLSSEEVQNETDVHRRSCSAANFPSARDVSPVICESHIFVIYLAGREALGS